MLEHSDVAARLPAQDLARAKSFYRDKLALTPSEERPRWSSLPVWKRLVLPVRIGRRSVGQSYSVGMGS
jgi:hypothetical protein